MLVTTRANVGKSAGQKAVNGSVVNSDGRFKKAAIIVAEKNDLDCTSMPDTSTNVSIFAGQLYL
jgi:hypothetical protein